jgi:hypothetical protein
MMADPVFLTGLAIQKEVRRLMSMPGDAVVAVAFWGAGGSSRIGLSPRRPGSTRVLCDLFSGSCNPDEIAALRAAKVSVRTMDGMHAKVWCVGDVAIVGSANASANGLGFEGKEVSGNIEAAVLVRDAAFALKVRTWFDDLWIDRVAARPVGKTEIEEARLLWKRRRSSRHRQFTRTILAAVDAPGASARFKSVKVIAYVAGGLTPEAEQAFSLKGRSAYEQQELARYDEAGVLPLYQDGGTWTTSPGDVLVDFHITGKSQRLVCTGLWRVRDEGRIPAPSSEMPKNGIVLLDELLDIDGIRLPAAEAKSIAGMLEAYVAAKGVSLDGIEVGLLQLCRSNRRASSTKAGR